MIETSLESEKYYSLDCTLFFKFSDEPLQVLTQNVMRRRPHSFNFENLIPNTEYNVWFSTSPNPTLASFKTKCDEDMDSFQLIALSCDR